jgi:hypothetical protein
LYKEDKESFLFISGNILSKDNIKKENPFGGGGSYGDRGTREWARISCSGPTKIFS